MSRSSGHSTRGSTNLPRILGLVVAAIVLVLAWNVYNQPRTVLNELPHYVASEDTRLGMELAKRADTINSHELWLVEFAGNQINQRIVPALPVSDWLDILECHDWVNTLCAIEHDLGSDRYTVHPWEISESRISHGKQSIQLGLNDQAIFAISPIGIFFSDTGFGGLIESIYQQDDSNQRVIATEDVIGPGCLRRPILSPNRKYVAVMCWPNAAHKPFDPYEPTGQQIHLFEVDSSLHDTLIKQNTYDIRSGWLAGIPEPFPGGFEWSPDSTEIAFIASFSPPQPLASTNAAAAIYSVSVIDDSLHEWVTLGNLPLVYVNDNQTNADPYLAWSPDNKYIAYTLSGRQVHIASRNGQSAQIGNFNFHIQILSWSADGQYITIAGDDQLWVLSTSDYAWQRVPFTGEITDLARISPTPP